MQTANPTPSPDDPRSRKTKSPLRATWFSRLRFGSGLPNSGALIETFEERLALSASPGAETIVELWNALDTTCHPLPAVPWESTPWESSAAMQLHQQSLFGEGEGAGSLGSILDQAAILRDQYQLTGEGQTVAVIDSGIAWDHVALGQGFGPGYRVVGGWDFAENDSNPYDDAPAGYHGTHVTGLIAGNSSSLQGVAPNVDVVGLRVFTDSGQGSLDWIESALQWVYENRNSFEHPITTVNLSLGALIPESLSAQVQAQFEDELSLLREANIVVVAAAGNQFNASTPDQLNYPAASESVWAVASTDSNGQLSSFSQRSDDILATTGRGILSSIPDHVLGWDGNVNDYHAATGTSMAAPQVAGAAVLLREAAESIGTVLNPDEMLSILQETAVRSFDAVSNNFYSQIDLVAAIDYLFASQPDQDPDGESTPQDQPRDVYDLGMTNWGSGTIDSTDELRVTAAQTGTFSIVDDLTGASFSGLRIADTAGKILWDGSGDATQIDLQVNGGDTLVITTTSPTATKLHFANIVAVSADNLNVNLGEIAATINVDITQGLSLQISQFEYHYATGQVTRGVIDGGAGADQLFLQGNAASGRLILNPYADGSWNESGISLTLRQFEEVTYDGGAGADRVYLYDTTGDDRLTANPGSARLEGVGFMYEISNVARSYVHATAGGQDVAFLHDSSGDDRLAVRPQFVSLRNDEFFNSASGFERVFAYATSGGNDVADIYDSAGDDRLTASSTSAMISGPNYYVQARNFDSVTGHAVAGGNDWATLYANDASASRWVRTEDQLTLRAEDGSERTARGFERVETFAAGVPVQVNTLATYYQQIQERERLILQSLFAAQADNDE